MILRRGGDEGDEFAEVVRTAHAFGDILRLHDETWRRAVIHGRCDGFIAGGGEIGDLLRRTLVQVQVDDGATTIIGG